VSAIFRAVGMFALLLIAGCGREPGNSSNAGTNSSPATKSGISPAFTDATEATGLRFRHYNGMSGQWYMPEMVAPGAALFDFDNDGDLDLFIVQGTLLGTNSPLPGMSASQSRSERHHHLFRNDLTRDASSSATIRWTDISAETGLKDLPSDYGMGVAAGDYDNDGFVDLYLANFGPNRLLKNEAGKRLVDATARAKGDLADPRWSISASWFDFDRDGWLDLVCCNYVAFTFERHRTCYSKTGAPDYCGPQVYPPLSHRLWRNRGDGTFEDVTARAGLLGREGAGLGVITADFDGDGWQDFLIANDGMANFLWLNQTNGTFKECALERGCALNGMGASEANMGVIAADLDEDGDEDVVITHLTGEKMTLFENWKQGWFSDVSAAAGIDGPTRTSTGFGLAAMDYDNDGWLDLLSANGAVKVIESQRRAGLELPMQQHAQLFRGIGNRRFVEITNESALRVMEIGRGLAAGDVDNDGDVDAVFANNNGPARLVLNQIRNTRSWLGVDLRLPTAGGRAAFGARVEAELSDGRKLHRRCASDGSYASASDPRVIFGLGDRDAGIRVIRLRVNWPDGKTESWSNLELNRYHTLARGGATP
jgi:enediyne biosynthesis protein E4